MPPRRRRGRRHCRSPPARRRCADPCCVSWRWSVPVGKYGYGRSTDRMEQTRPGLAIMPASRRDGTSPSYRRHRVSPHARRDPLAGGALDSARESMPESGSSVVPSAALHDLAPSLASHAFPVFTVVRSFPTLSHGRTVPRIALPLAARLGTPTWARLGTPTSSAPRRLPSRSGGLGWGHPPEGSVGDTHQLRTTTVALAE